MSILNCVIKKSWRADLLSLNKVAEEILTHISKQPCVVAIYGNLGAGKTTLCKEIIRRALNDDSLNITSPTFCIMKTYDVKSRSNAVTHSNTEQYENSELSQKEIPHSNQNPKPNSNKECSLSIKSNANDLSCTNITYNMNTIFYSNTTPISYPILHADMYRISEPDEIFELGMLDLFESHICLIEWPQNIEEYLPSNRFEIHINESNVTNERIINFYYI